MRNFAYSPNAKFQGFKIYFATKMLFGIPKEKRLIRHIELLRRAN